MQARAHQTLTEGQIQQLQWVLPTPFSSELMAFFRTQKAIGAKLRFTAAGTEHWLGVFDLERMVDEVLRWPNTTLSDYPRLLPFAGCGRRRTTVYLVDVTDASVWLLDSGKKPESLGLGLEQLWASAKAEPRVNVRRRIPAQKVLSRSSRGTSRAAQKRVEPTCARTLSLFPDPA